MNDGDVSNFNRKFEKLIRPILEISTVAFFDFMLEAIFRANEEFLTGLRWALSPEGRYSYIYEMDDLDEELMNLYIEYEDCRCLRDD